MICFLCFGLFVINALRLTLGQNEQSSGYECCSIYMMDARGMVAIETRRQLTSGSFVALKIRACTTSSVAIQIWRLVSNNTFNFRWQTVVTPVLSTTGKTFVMVNFSSPLVITSDDRLGVFSPADNFSNLATPYGFDEERHYLYYSSASFSSFSAFSDSLQVTTDDLRWPRSFNGSIFFCTEAGCPDVAQTSTVTPTPYSPYTPPTGVTLSNQCCPNPVQCDTTGIDFSLQNQTNLINQLQQEVNDITKIIRDLLSSRTVTGICPQGFTSGTYGVGKCYLAIQDRVPMAVAAIRCHSDYNTLLVQIKSFLEDDFFRSWLSTTTPSGTVSFWTAGMYNTDVHQWFWYDESLRVKSPMTYTNWRNNVRPVPSTDSDVCMKLVITQGVTNSSYWEKTDCNENNFFICQVLKSCF